MSNTGSNKKIKQGDNTKAEAKNTLDRVIPIRLSAADWEQLREKAKESGIGISTLARTWVTECLHLKDILPGTFQFSKSFEDALRDELIKFTREIPDYDSTGKAKLDGSPEAALQKAVSVAPEANNNALLNIMDVIDSVPFYVLLVDEHHRVILANKAVRAHLGLDPQEIIGKYCPKVVHGIDEPFGFPGCPLEEAVTKNQAVEREVFDEKSGHWVISAIYPIGSFTQDGKKIFFHMVADITARKKAEEQLKASQEQLRSLWNYIESVREEERKKIARDLHDETSQLAASLNAYLEAAASRLPANSGEVKGLLKKAQDSSSRIIEQLHALIYSLRPSIIDDLGLVAAIRWLKDSSFEVAGIKAAFTVTGHEKNLPSELKMAVFRVVQEAFSNILRHANAKNVVLDLSFKKSTLGVRIKDDGSGFNVEDAIKPKNRPRGLGIVGMRERIELLNGSFEIHSSQPGGTEINITIPIESKPALGKRHAVRRPE